MTGIDIITHVLAEHDLDLVGELLTVLRAEHFG
jgi:hypothetical protein